MQPSGSPRFWLQQGNLSGLAGVLFVRKPPEDAAMADVLHAAGLFAALYLVLILMRFT
ncbi:MAG: hypothetical protein RMK15_07450 [Chloroflexota bacterium]|nr:hypothetical protein [Dehalococcoidia bacterium]MDW8047096.1 hypothetical protein [Chloroflexota bacterium]